MADATVVIDPTDHKHILVGSRDFNCTFPSELGFHVSRDGGSTWSVKCLDSIITHDYVFWPVGPDASVAYDSNGVAYIAGDYADSETGNNGFVGFEKSADGVHWSPPAVALHVPARGGISFTGDTWLTIDTNLQSPHLNDVYVSGVVVGGDSQQYDEVVVSHSSDGGNRWHDVVVAGVQVFPALDYYTNMAVGKDGTVYLTWMYCNTGPNACNDHRAYMLFSKSSDGGSTWSKPRLMTTATLMSTYLPNTNVSVTNYPVIGVDNSLGPHTGNLYVAFYNWTGSYVQVDIIRSSDGGATWSKPVPVAPKQTHDQFFPWLSVSPTGLIGVSWLDRRNDPANIDYQAFAAISTDGGQSFAPNIQLTTAFSDPNNSGYPGWMGNRTGNTWAASNFIAAWMDSSNGVNMQTVVGGIRLK